MHADIDEHAEVDDVAHGAGQHHAGLEVLYLEHVLTQQHWRQLIARVAAGLEKLSGNIAQGRLTDAARLSGSRDAVVIQALPEIRELACLDVGHSVPANLEELRRGVIALGVDGGVIEHLLALRHAQEACTLLEGLGAELRHLVDGLAAGEDTVLLAIGDNVLRGGFGKPRHAL